MQHNRKERHRSHVAQPTWTIQLLHQTVNSFLQNNSRRWPLQVERNEAEHYVITKSYLYLGIPISSKTLLNPPHTNPQAKPLDVLDKFMPMTTVDFEVQQELLAMRQCCKEWPLARFALVVLWQAQPTEVTVPERLSRINPDSVSLTGEYLYFPLYWATDICFIPPYSQESNIKSLIKNCCLTGNVDALRLLFKLMQSYKHRYESLHRRRYLMSGHDRQMIQGAIQAINYLEDQGALCRHQLKEALHKLNKQLLKQESVETSSNKKIFGKCCLSDIHTCSGRRILSERSTSPDETIARKNSKLEASQFETTSLQLNKSNVAESQQTIQIYGKSTSCQKITVALKFILKSLSIDVGFRPFLELTTRNDYIALFLF
ncbi:hypothetical protein K456DRAFT_1179529 [Colletotrichum gloeosporioides 23]|nr:hypothetical protein K456DRAFT_1179529 [Colletotrichum gloeosporioides 23]